MNKILLTILQIHVQLNPDNSNLQREMENCFELLRVQVIIKD